MMVRMTHKVVVWKLLDSLIVKCLQIKCMSVIPLFSPWWPNCSERAHVPARRTSTTVLQTICTHPYYESAPVQNSLIEHSSPWCHLSFLSEAIEGLGLSIDNSAPLLNCILSAIILMKNLAPKNLAFVIVFTRALPSNRKMYHR